VHEHLSNLERKGYIRRNYNESRSVEPMEPAHQAGATRRGVAAVLPLHGLVAAGLPIEAIEQDEAVCVPEDMLSGHGPHYVLRVRGDSMIDDQIRDGDCVVVDGRDVAENGETVIALINGESATVKRFYREGNGQIRLQPANDSHAPQYYDENDVLVQGVVIGVIRKY
jgi:repressor LexA